MDSAETLWRLARNSSTNETAWKRAAERHFELLMADVHKDYTRNYMTPGDLFNTTHHIKWSFPASIFFSLTAITTIGYGHIVPRTIKGRIACLVYALLGIPLILVTIADVGRFLSHGIIWLHNLSHHLWLWLKKRLSGAFGAYCRCLMRKKTAEERMIERLQRIAAAANSNYAVKKRELELRSPDRSGTFEDISDIQSQLSPKTGSQETHARADELPEEEPPVETRVSLLFVFVIILTYTAGGALLMRLWEEWDFFDAFYFCFVTVTTIGFGDIVPHSEAYIWATLLYIIVGLILTTMCIDLVGSEYIRDIHFYGREIGKSFLTIGGKVVHLGEVFGYVAFLQKNYGITAEQLDRMANLPDDYLLDCMIHGQKPDLSAAGRAKPFVPHDIYFYKWIEQPRTSSYVSDRLLASMDSLDFLSSSRCTTARTLTPREYYQRVCMHHCVQANNNNGDIFDKDDARGEGIVVSTTRL